MTGLSLQWAALDDLLLHLSRRLADLTGLLSLITRPERSQSHLHALRLVPSGERLLIFLVAGSAAATSLNLRLPAQASDELPALERWAANQLQLGQGGQIDWNALPQLNRSGRLVRQALQSHQEAGLAAGGGAVATGLAGLLGQPEFSQTATLRPLVELVEDAPSRCCNRAASGLGPSIPTPPSGTAPWCKPIT